MAVSRAYAAPAPVAAAIATSTQKPASRSPRFSKPKALVAGFFGGGFRWFWFVVSCVFFVAVAYIIWVPLRQEALRGQTEGRRGLFFTLAGMLTVLWFLYPVVWLVSTTGTNAVGPGVEVFFFALLDILAKIAFGFVLLGGIRQARGARA